MLQTKNIVDGLLNFKGSELGVDALYDSLLLTITVI
jgi:hypothetical protein